MLVQWTSNRVPFTYQQIFSGYKQVHFKLALSTYMNKVIGTACVPLCVEVIERYDDTVVLRHCNLDDTLSIVGVVAGVTRT